MSVLSEKGETLVESLPVYAQEDTTIRALLDAVGKELQRLDDYLSNLRATLQPQTATDEFLRYWESFLDLPVAPDGISDAQRLNTINAAVRRRSAGPGAGWKSLLDAIAENAPWQHEENSDATGDYFAYGIRFYGVQFLTTDYRVGIFDEMARRITPAHLDITAVTIAGDDTFRVGVSEVGDLI